MAEEVIRRVLANYDLGELRSARRVGRGFVNENWIVDTTRDRFFLKRRHPELRNHNLICAQHALNKHLRESGFPAPAILHTTAGETLLVLDGDYFEIQEHIEGVPYEHTNDAHFQAAAFMLGSYHACVHDFTFHPHCDLGDLYSPPILAEHLTSLINFWELDRDPALAQILKQLASHAADLAVQFSEHHGLPCLIIHGDYHAGNLLFQGDRLVGVVDFDKACWQPRVVELAEALIYFASPCPGHLKHLVYPGFLDWDKLESFLRYYSYGFSLAEKETPWLPSLVQNRDRVDYLKDIFLKDKEIFALPNYICCIWLSISLKCLAEKDACPAPASEVLREIVDLGDWSVTNRQRMIGTICSVIQTGSDPGVGEYS
ncbi:MAG: phosphotransferase [Syntrophobacterales bacterium]|jgi:homoserine kinase type II